MLLWLFSMSALNSIVGMSRCSLIFGCLSILSLQFTVGVSTAEENQELEGRAELNWRYGNDRSIVMSEFWVPFAQDGQSVLYSSLRMMGDDQDNREGNLGIGYRRIVEAPILGDGVLGGHAWIDRRITERGTKLHQVTLGAEWLGEHVDVLANGYAPLNSAKRTSLGEDSIGDPFLSGTGIFVSQSSAGEIIEEPQMGFDMELGLEIPYLKSQIDSARLYGGGFYFDGEDTESIAGWRTRLAVDVTSDFQIGSRFQRDDVRGSQGFLEATIRFPFGQKKSYREYGLYARLDDSPERDIDIVTGTSEAPIINEISPVINEETGDIQEVLYVKNDAAGGGDGSLANPYNTLAAAQAASSEGGIIYVYRGDGTTANLNQGITLDKDGVQLIGSGTAFMYDAGRFGIQGGGDAVNGTTLIAAGAAPTLTNVNAGQDIVTITADNVVAAGFIADGTAGARDGVAVIADGGAASATNVTLLDITATDNDRHGVYIHGANGGDASALVQNVAATSNDEHGVVVYDDTSGTFDVDLGGGAMGSTGQNTLSGNTLEDLAVEYDGRSLSAENNWWGQASGPDTDAPDVGIRPQIFYGAPVNNGLVSHWTFDTEWTTNTTAYDRSGLANDGVLQGGLSLADQVAGANRGALSLDGVDDFISTTTAFNDPNVFTIITGFRTASNSGKMIVAFESTQTSTASIDHDRKIYLGTDGTLRFGIFDGSTDAAEHASTYADSQFYNVAATVDGAGDMDLYVDATLLDTANTTNPQSYTGYWRIGSYQGPGWVSSSDGYFAGEVDDTRIYNRALDANEIAEIDRMDTSSSVSTANFRTSAP